MTRQRWNCESCDKVRCWTWNVMRFPYTYIYQKCTWVYIRGWNENKINSWGIISWNKQHYKVKDNSLFYVEPLDSTSIADGVQLCIPGGRIRELVLKKAKFTQPVLKITGHQFTLWQSKRAKTCKAARQIVNRSGQNTGNRYQNQEKMSCIDHLLPYKYTRDNSHSLYLPEWSKHIQIISVLATLTDSSCVMFLWTSFS